jgi:mycobactin peptide synthetase MbtE
MPTLTGMVQEAAGTHPDAVAVDGPEGVLTYRDLWSAAREQAEHLVGTGASAVAVTGTRGHALVTAVLAVLQSGARLVTVDPELPAARRSAMLSDSGAELLVTATDDGCRTSPLDGASGEPGTAGGYVFFTSGTTARPKAVLGRWSSLAHFVAWQRDRFGIVPGDRFAQLTALSFDVVLRDLFTPLVSGATICLPPADVARRDGGVPAWLRDARVTVVHTVPSLAARWTSAATPAAPAGDALRLTFFAGEPLSHTVVERWRQRIGSARVLNLYGPTETTLAKFCHEVTDPVPGVQPVGFPLPGAEVRLVDGEVWIRTPHRSDGYLGAPEEQRRRFVPAEDGGDLWYRTGDLGRFGPDGELFLDGRLDFQVKINGNRVEPEGVAAELRAHPAVHDAVVVARRRADGAHHLACCYAAAPGTAGEEVVRAWLAERLPAAHVPSVLRRLDALPLTANGKVDRNALPLLPEGAASGPEQSPGDATGDATGAAVLDVFRRVLAAPSAGPAADFFACGGTSLDAAVLSGELLTATGRRIEMSDVYTLRSPRALAAAVRHRPPQTQTAIPHLPDGEQPAVTGLSPQQRRYRSVYLPRVNRSWSNMPALFPVPDGTDGARVEAALNAVVARHDALRASFTENDGELTQHFREGGAVTVESVDLRDLPDQAQRARMEEMRIAEANSPISLHSWPLFRATLIRHHSCRATLLWTVHHMVSDGYSQGVLLRELQQVLGGGGPGSLPDLPISYRDYLRWRTGQPEEQAKAQRDYWQGVFKEPYERPLLPELPGVVQPARGVAFQFPVPDELHDEVGGYCRTHGVTAFSVCFAAYLLMVHRLFGREDLVVGTPAAGRTRPEFKDLIGNFISLVGIRHRRGEATSFSELVLLLQERTLAAMEHQDYQYDQVMDDIGAERDDDRFPLTTVFISLVDTPAAQADGLRTAAHRDLGCEVKFDLMGYLRRSGGKLALDLHTRQGLLDRERLEWLREVFLGELRAGLKGQEAAR